MSDEPTVTENETAPENPKPAAQGKLIWWGVSALAAIVGAGIGWALSDAPSGAIAGGVLGLLFSFLIPNAFGRNCGH
jgi:hypothetical protein